MKRNLTRKERITKAGFKSVFNGRKSVKGPFSKLVFLENGLAFSRFAVSLGKKYGNAVCRNYAKRVFKEIYRHHKEKLKKGYDIVLVLYEPFASYQQAETMIDNFFKKACLCIDQ